MVLDRLRKLARFRGDLTDSLFGFLMATAVAQRVEGYEEFAAEREAYLGRYMPGLSLERLEDLPARRVDAYVRAVSSIVKRENGDPKRQTGDGGPSL